MNILILNVSIQINIDKFIINKTIKIKIEKCILRYKMLFYFVIQNNIKAFKGLTIYTIL